MLDEYCPQDYCLVEIDSFSRRIEAGEYKAPTMKERSFFKGWLRRRGEPVEDLFREFAVAKLGPMSCETLRMLFVRRWIIY